MHIIPYTIERPDNKSTSSSGSSHREYEIWRRWEDCLWFQEILEMEYSVMAREKRTRLARGKGVKKNGIYVHSDQAASFESLPPGPEAQSIAKDIHEIIPKLTKKASIFRASQATIDQRAKEFKDMITTLFSDDVPTLIKDLRDQRIIRDFFGTWRRDQDLARKSNNIPNSRRASVSSSVFSMYFASSNLSVQPPSSIPEYPSHPPLPSVVHPATAPSSATKPPYSGSGSGPGSDHTTSSSSLASASRVQLPHSAPAISSTSNSSPKFSESEDDSRSSIGSRTAPRSFRWSTGSSRSSDSSQEFPMYLSESQRQEQPGLQALPEDQELTSDMSAMSIGTADNVRPIVGRRPRINSCPDRGNRNGLIFTTPPQQPIILDSDTISPLDEARTTDTLTPPMTASSTQFDSLPQSRPTSMAFSTFSELSQQSSWRTSVISESSLSPRQSCADINYLRFDLNSLEPRRSDIFLPALEDTSESQSPRQGHEPRASISTLGSLVSEYSLESALGPLHHSDSQSSLRRAFSVGSRRPASVLSNNTTSGGLWYEQEDLIDTYFYGMCTNYLGRICSCLQGSRSYVASFSCSA